MTEIFYQVHECLNCDQGYVAIIKHVHVSSKVTNFLLCKHCKEHTIIGNIIEENHGGVESIPHQYHEHMIQAGTKLMESWLVILGREK